MVFLQYGEDPKTTGAKFLWDCKTIDVSNSTTKDWLENVSALKTISKTKAIGMGHKKLLEALFHKRSKVVVKVADSTESLDTEWKSFEILKANKLPGFLEYFCYFRCNDTIVRFAKELPHLCEGPGESLQVLTMEYVPHPSFKNTRWTDIDIKCLKACMQQAMCSIWEAYEVCGFVHSDFHLDNILVCPTTTTTISYPSIQLEQPTNGYRIKIMDLELSRTGVKHPRSFLMDLREFFRKWSNDISTENSIVQGISNKIARLLNADSPTYKRSDILGILQDIESITSIQTFGGYGKKDTYLPSLHKKTNP
jgi:hypothetical protein